MWGRETFLEKELAKKNIGGAGKPFCTMVPPPHAPSFPKTFGLIESLISAFPDSKKPSQEQGRLFFFGNPLQRGFDKDESLWGGKGEVWRGEGGPF